MQSVSSNAVANALTNKANTSDVMQLTKNIANNNSNTVSLSTLPQEVYLVFATDLYHSHNPYEVGILRRYITSSNIYNTYSSISKTNLSISISGENLVTSGNAYLFTVKFFKVGYY